MVERGGGQERGQEVWVSSAHILLLLLILILWQCQVVGQLIARWWGRLGVYATKCNSARRGQPDKKTHTTPSCTLQAVEWWLYSGGRKIQQQQSAKMTGRGSLKDAGGCDWLPDHIVMLLIYCQSDPLREPACAEANWLCGPGTGQNLFFFGNFE